MLRCLRLLGVGGALLISLTLLHAQKASSLVTNLAKVRVAQGGRTFVTERGQPFVPFGVNYYRPGTGWAPQVWRKFDAEATRRDFARMKELGVNCVRVFLSYGSFYMEPDKLKPEGLAKFDQFLALAESEGIYVHPTGPDHWEEVPGWARGDRIADEKVLSALESFWKLFAARYRGRHVIFAYDLRNEPEVAWDNAVMKEKWNRWLEQRYGSADKLAEAWNATNRAIQLGSVPAPEPKDASGSRELLDYQLFREEVADAWTRRQVAAVKSVDPQALVTVGLIQWSVPSLLPGVQHYSGFRPERQARLLDFLEIHFYPLEHGALEYRSDEEEVRNLAYLESVVREVARPGKPVVVAEFGWYGGGKPTFDGGTHPAASEEQQARWCQRVVEITAGLATGWLNWGFYDQPEATDTSQLTGLLTCDGKLKAWGKKFKELADQFQARPPAPRKLNPRPALDWSLCLTSAAAQNKFREEYGRAFQNDEVIAHPKR
ncbi:MAG: cellulase family glycosylhydrolase [Verrucomicrobia bacterium]|nr:cellulase family glycosylhydrolase [Verrucomicrobiota bacterium]